MDTTAIQAQGSDARGGGKPAAGPPQRSANGLVAEVRRLLNDGEVYDARQLVAESVKEHPEHPDLLRIHEILNVGRSRRRPATGRSTREDLEWLRDPPDEYRGKWVALIGRDVVGTGSSLKELVAGLPSDLDQTPLAVQIAS